MGKRIQDWFVPLRGLTRSFLGWIVLLLFWVLVRFWLAAPRLTGSETLDRLYGKAAANLLGTWLLLWLAVWVVVISLGWLDRKTSNAAKQATNGNTKHWSMSWISALFLTTDDGTIGALLRRPVNMALACILAAGATALMYVCLTLPDFQAATNRQYEEMYEARRFAELHGLNLVTIAKEINHAAKSDSKKGVELGGQAKVFVSKYLTLSPEQKLRNRDWQLLADYLNAQAGEGPGEAEAASKTSSINALRDKIVIPLIREWGSGYDFSENMLNDLISNHLRRWLATTRPFGVQADSPLRVLQGILADVAASNPNSRIVIPEASAAALAMAESILLRHKEEMAPFHRAVDMLASSYIQPATFWLFFIALVLLHARECIPLVNSRRLGTESYTDLLSIRIHSGASSPADRLVEAENALERVEYRSLEYLIWAMPSLGFIGTVVGVGAALGNADKVVAAVSKTEQRDAIAAVTSVLGVAFDTTLVALVCLVPTLLLAAARRRNESRMLIDALNHPKKANPVPLAQET